MYEATKSLFVGYIDKKLFKCWFEDLFLHLCGNERPVLLLMDNHDSHYSYETLQMDKQNKVMKMILQIKNATNQFLQCT